MPSTRVPGITAVGLLIVGAAGAAPRAVLAQRASPAISRQVLTVNRTPFALELELPARARRGDSVAITMRVRNTGTVTADLELQGRPPAFDIVVAAPDGRPVWRRLRGEVVGAVLVLRSLAPGESIAFTAPWPQHDDSGNPVAPGRYRIRGLLPRDQGSLATREHDLMIVP